MRKTLALIVSVLMIVTLFSFGTSAADPVKVTTAAEFAAMAADGNYILDNDLTLTSAYADTFTGTFDGNGHTITVEVPVFTALTGATVKNLVIKGTVENENGKTGALAPDVTGMCLIENVTNKATVKNTLAAGKDACVGGLVGKVNNDKVDDSAPTFKNCRNEGAVSGPEATGGIAGESQETGTAFIGCYNSGKVTSISTDSGTGSGGIIGYNGTGFITLTDCVNDGEMNSQYRAGGIVADARKGANITGCVNNGKIIAKADGTTGSIAGGIVGYAIDSGATVFSIVGCINHGDVDAYVEGFGLGDAAGIAGNVGAKSGICGAYTVRNCFTDGDITGGYRAGGIFGYVYGSGADQHAFIENCIVEGSVASARFASEFIGYTNSWATTIKNSVGAATLATYTNVPIPVTGSEPVVNYVPRICIFGCSSTAVEQCVIENVTIVDGGKTEWYTWAGWDADDPNADNRIPLSAVLGKDLSGSTYKYDTYSDDKFTLVSADNEKTYTNSEETPVNVKAITRLDALTEVAVNSANAAGNTVKFYFKDGSAVLTAPAGPTPPTGDSAVYYIAVAVVAMVAVVGTAWVSKKVTVK